jgi:glycerophosphoryl diester phosphodiesterase
VSPIGRKLRAAGYGKRVARRRTRIRTELCDRAFFDAPTPLAFAHRGFSPRGLENSLTAFAAAVELGYRYLETDVRATRDGVAIALHDPTLDRVTDRTGRICELDWSEAGRALIGGSEPLARLDDVLDAWSDIRLNIDVKDAAAVAPLARAIERTKAHDRVCVASFSDRRRRAVLRRLSAPVATAGGRWTIARFRLAASPVRWAALVTRALRDVDCVQVPERAGRVRIVTSATVAAARAAGKQVHVWTVNDESRMHRLLDIGVHGLVTDRADVLKDILLARDAWPEQIIS